MCFGGGSKSPPDYSSQKAAAARQAEKRYARQAADYNSAVKGFNKSLDQHASWLSGASSGISRMGIADLYGQNDESYRNQISGRINSLSALSAPDRPSFDKIISTEWGNVGVNNIPSLSNANTDRRESMLGSMQGLIGQLDSLEAQRAEEERRVREAQQGFNSRLSQLESGISGLTIADDAAMNSFASQLSGLGADVGGFYSPIASNMGVDFGNIRNKRNSLSSQIAELRNKRSEELNRIRSYEDSLRGYTNTYDDLIDDMGIADYERAAELQNEIEDRIRVANQFQSPLSFDFSDELGGYGLGGMASRLGQLQMQAEAEKDRISREGDRFQSSIRSLEDSLSDASFYDLNAIRSMERRYDDLQGDITGFESELPFDFSEYEAALPGFGESITGLRTQRQDTLDSLLSGVNTFGEGIGDIALTNEEELLNRRDSLHDIMAELTMFRGGNLSEIENPLTKALGDVDLRLGELEDKRGEITDEAEDFWEELQGRQFRDPTRLESYGSELEDLLAMIDDYGVQGTGRFTDPAQSLLDSETDRLARDAENRNKALEASQAAFLASMGPGGQLTAQDPNLVDPMTSSEYQRYLAALARQRDDERDYYRNSLNSLFSRNMGVIRV